MTPGPSGTASAAPGASLEAVVHAMDLLAGDVTQRHAAFADVVNAMRQGSLGMAYPTVPFPPPRSARAAALIQDPLVFQLSKLDAAGTLEMGQWWSSLPPEDRHEFARFFGLWCAQRRPGR